MQRSNMGFGSLEVLFWNIIILEFLGSFFWRWWCLGAILKKCILGKKSARLFI